MHIPWVKNPLFDLAGHHITALGVAAFVGLFVLGLLVARLVQSAAVRRFLSRFKLDANFVAIITTILSVAALVFFTVTAVNGLGVPLSWSAPLPGVPISLLQIFLLIALLFLVFWISSRTKRFLFNRFLVHSGLDRSLQYAISQIVSNLVLVVGVFIVLQNTGIHLEALTVFAGAVGVGVGFGLQNITSNFISGLVILAERPITIGDRVRSRGRDRAGAENPGAQHGDRDERQHHHDRAEPEVHRFAGDELDLRRSPSAFSHSGRRRLRQRYRTG